VIEIVMGIGSPSMIRMMVFRKVGEALGAAGRPSRYARGAASSTTAGMKCLEKS
jgi:hypothetical protein